MKRRFRQVRGELVEVGPDIPEPNLEPKVEIMPDIKPYRSMIDGSMITSRSRHREHLRQHGCVEVGNDSSLRAQPKPLESPPGLKEVLIENANRFLRRR